MTNLVTDSEKALKGTQVEKARTTNWIGFDESSNCILTRVINKHMARGEITLESVCEL